MSGTSKQGISLKRSQDNIQVQVDESSKCIKKKKVEEDTELEIPKIKGKFFLKKVPMLQSTLDLVKFLGSRVYLIKLKNLTKSNIPKSSKC